MSILGVLLLLSLLFSINDHFRHRAVLERIAELERQERIRQHHQ